RDRNSDQSVSPVWSTTLVNYPMMKQNFAAMILGGTGQVGGAAVAELLAIPECREVLSQGPMRAVSCVGVGSGSSRWSEEELQRLELGVVGAFARGCQAAGVA